MRYDESGIEESGRRTTHHLNFLSHNFRWRHARSRKSRYQGPQSSATKVCVLGRECSDAYIVCEH